MKAKLEQIHEECISVTNKNFLSRRAFQSLLGKLLYIHKFVRPAHIFLNRILTLFKENFDQKKIKLTPSFFSGYSMVPKISPCIQWHRSI